MKDEIQKIEPQELAPMNVGAMMQSFLKSGITQENVQAFSELVKLKREEDALQAEREFARAFVGLQGDMPSVRARKCVKNNSGVVMYKYAPFEEIMEQVSPLLQKHGFTVTFSTDYPPEPPQRIAKTCTLQHIGGHKRTNTFAARLGKGPPNSSEAQGDGAASTYAKRFALCDALCIAIEKDDDARAEGSLEPITAQQATDLKTRVKATGSDEKKFLAFARSQTFEVIPASKFTELDEMLKRKEVKK